MSRAMTPNKKHTLKYGTNTIEYTLTLSKRKTLAIEVHPDQQVRVKAPLDIEPSQIEDFVVRKAAWIERKQRKFATYPPPVPPPRYVSGETHLYLGRAYRLKLKQGWPETVTRGRSYIHITVRDKSDTERVKWLLTEWYRTQAHQVFRARLDLCFKRVSFLNVDYPALHVRRMEKRWGSCTSKGKIILSLKLMQAPTPLIDYVVMHELCHLREHNHSPRFYALLDQAMPDWRQKRDELNQLAVK